MMAPVISVACRQFKMKNTLFSCAVARKCVCVVFLFLFFSFFHANVFVEASICRLVSRFTYGSQNYYQSDWSFFISLKLVLKMSSIFFQKQTNDSYRFISELMDVFQSLWMAGVHQQPDQSNYLAEGQT